jgi:iron-sulfur cluster assembly protein
MITITERAADEFRRAVRTPDSAEPRAGLRLRVTGGGCGGFQHDLCVESAPLPADVTFSQHGVEIYVDPLSFPYVDGAEIDYIDTPQGCGFTVRGVHHDGACGCGASFPS